MKKIMIILFAVLFINRVEAQNFFLGFTALQPTCQDKKNGEINIIVNGGIAPFQYLWSNGSSLKDLKNLTAAQYSVTVTDATGAKAQKSIDLTEVNYLEVYLSENNPSCDGTSKGSIFTTLINTSPPPAAYTYKWNNGKDSSKISSLSAGTFSVTVSDSYGCTATKSIILKGELYFDIIGNTVDVCENTTKLQAINPKGTPPFSYQWAKDGGTVVDKTSTIDAVAGIYYVTVTDATGCSGEKLDIIVGNAENTISLKELKPSACNSGVGEIAVTSLIAGNKTAIKDWSNYKFAWSNGIVKTGDTTLTGLASGTYTVTITAPKGCTFTKEITLFDTSLKIGFDKFQPCLGKGNLSLTAKALSGGTAPYNFLWNNGATTSEIKNISPNNYDVTVSDSKGCKNTATTFIGQSSFLIQQVGVKEYATSCPKIIVDTIYNGVPPFAYQWSNGQTTANIDYYPLTNKGAVSITITDSQGCTNDPQWAANSIFQLAHYYYKIETCNNQASIVPKCGSPKFKYQWDNGSTNSTATNLSAGLHTVTITETFHNISNVDTVNVNPNKPCPITTFIKGSIKRDANANCLSDLNEQPYKNQIVEFLPGPNYASTDNNGFYKAFLPTGNYTVGTVTNFYGKNCQNNVAVTLVDSASVDFPIKALINCPYMEVDISSPILRRCFDNNYYVKYCNNGTATAKNASIKIDFDENYMTYKSASIPLSSSQNGVLTFNVGDVAVGECKNFSISLYLSCTNGVMGQTHCVKARIFPDSLCKIPTSSTSAKVVASAQCNGQQVVLSLQNKGAKDMVQSKNYLIIEDQVIFKQGNFKLNVNEILDFKFPANGKTYRIEAEQDTTYPLAPSKPSAWVEACGTNGQGSFNQGFVTIFGKGDDDPFTSVDCRQSVASYDPNIKEAYPKGYQAAHLLPQNEDLEYTLGFQNEGTDTAFTVVLRDTLDKSLDVNTLRVGASSHANKWSVSSNGILQFTFDKINLTTKNQNEEKSQGFVKFRISQEKDVALGTVIKNRVGIYFDFNAVVMTNEVFHTIGKDFLKVTSVKNPIFEKVEINVYPNPTNSDVIFDLQNIDNQSFELYLFDISGKIIRKENYDTARFLFKRENLSGGMYFYQIKTKGQLICNGKLIIF